MIIIGYKYLLLPALLNFSNGEEKAEMEMNGAKRRNEYIFFTVFRLPLLPLWRKKSIWKVDDELYQRPLSTGGKIFNQTFTLFGWFIIGLILTIITTAIGPLTTT
jgi:hypothetical protein